MPLVVPNVVRATINGRYLGNTMANVLDVYVNEVGAGRPIQIQRAMEDLGTYWDTKVVQQASNAYTALSIDWVDLTDANGLTGSLSSGPAFAYPAVGKLTGAPYAGNVATLVKKATESRRGERPGRMFLAPMTETDIADGIINASRLGPLNTALDEFLTNMTTEDWHLVVVHSTASASVGTSTQVTGLAADPKVSTQRRRWRR